MFHSINAYTGETLCRRPAQSYAEFAQELAALKVHQQAFARLGVTGRTALLQAFAERLAQNKERLAEMVKSDRGVVESFFAFMVKRPASLAAPSTLVSLVDTVA